MLDTNTLEALKQYTANMARDVVLVLKDGEHAKRAELIEFVDKLCSVSPRLHYQIRPQANVRGPLSFALEVDGQASGIQFSGLPGGHEFTSLVLAILQLSGTALKLDALIQKMVERIVQPLRFEVFVSLSCHNCPDVVQALNQFAVINPLIAVETIDGGVFPELIAERNIQGVPSVYLNGEVFSNGKIDIAQILERLQAKFPELKSTPQGPALPTQDVTIIGGGPAGIAAAIYSARKGLKVTLIADRIGGQVRDTMGIENLISVPKTTGPELTQNLREHMKDYDITLREHVRVEQVRQGEIKQLRLSSGEEISSKTLIVATGAKWRELNVPGEKENIGQGVAYCPHCDGPFFKGKDVAVIGGGNSGIEAALDLAGIVRSVTVLEFAPELKADQVLVKQAAARSNIRILKNVSTQEILAEGGQVTALVYQDRSTDKREHLPLSGVFVQIGLVPHSAVLKELVETTRFGEIIINEKCETSAPGIYACGDVTTVPYKQIVVAMGEGSKAALAAFEYLLKQA